MAHETINVTVDGSSIRRSLRWRSYVVRRVLRAAGWIAGRIGGDLFRVDVQITLEINEAEINRRLSIVAGIEGT